MTPAAASAAGRRTPRRRKPHPDLPRSADHERALLLVAEDLVPIPAAPDRRPGSDHGRVAEVTVTQVFVNPYRGPWKRPTCSPCPTMPPSTACEWWWGSGSSRGSCAKRRRHARPTKRPSRKGTGRPSSRKTANLFTTSVANLLPDQEVSVEMRYLQPLTLRGGPVSVRLSDGGVARLRAGVGPAAKPLVAEVQPPARPRPPQGLLRGDAVAWRSTWTPAFPCAGSTRRPHDVTIVEESGPTRVRIALSQSDEIPNRDFVLNYRVAGPRPEQALFLCEPGPRRPAGNLPAPRDAADAAVCHGLAARSHLRDRSLRLDGRRAAGTGQAGGPPAPGPPRPGRRLQRHCLRRPGHPLDPTPLVADEVHLRAARTFIDQIQTGGGTEMLEPLRLALQMPAAEEQAAGWSCSSPAGSVAGELAELAGGRATPDRAVAGRGLRHRPRGQPPPHRQADGGRARVRRVPLAPGRTSPARWTARCASYGTRCSPTWSCDGRRAPLRRAPRAGPDVYRDRPLVVVGRFRGAAPPASR